MLNFDHPPYWRNRLDRAFFLVQLHRLEEGAMARALLRYWLRQALKELERG